MKSYEIILKNNQSEAEILVTRCLFAVAAVASFVYAGEKTDYYLGVTLGIVLVILSLFVKTIINRYKLSRLALMGTGAIFTFITTGSILFAVILLIEGVFFQMLNKKVRVDINAESVIVQYVFQQKAYKWTWLQNVILKDGILTVDFKDDRLLQSEIETDLSAADESKFNEFCREQLQRADESNSMINKG